MIISCIHFKGGVGKTTTVCSLAGAAYAAGRRVLVVDLDPQGSAGAYFRVRGQPSTYAWLIRGQTLGDVAQRVRPREAVASDADPSARPLADEHSPAPPPPDRFETVDAEWPSGCIDVIRASERLSALQAALRTQRRFDYLAERFREDRELFAFYDYVFVDCPPGADYLAENALRASDVVLSAMEVAYMSMQGLLRVAAHIRNAAFDGYTPVWLVVPTRYRARRIQTRRVYESLVGQLGEFPDGRLLAPIPESVDLVHAYDAGVTVQEFDAGGRGAVAYGTVYRQLESYRTTDHAQKGVAADEGPGTAGVHGTARDAIPVARIPASTTMRPGAEPDPDLLADDAAAGDVPAGEAPLVAAPYSRSGVADLRGRAPDSTG